MSSSHLEHPCVIEPLRQLEARGFDVDWWPVDSRGIVSRAPLHPDTSLVCVMLAYHETRAIQPVLDIALSLPAGVAIHCDAAQKLWGKIPVNFRELGASSRSRRQPTKFGGPKGVGVLRHEARHETTSAHVRRAPATRPTARHRGGAARSRDGNGARSRYAKHGREPREAHRNASANVGTVARSRFACRAERPRDRCSGCRARRR